jgi:Na+/H+ antiporter NhaD/arsenite permease-like protein
LQCSSGKLLAGTKPHNAAGNLLMILDIRHVLTHWQIIAAWTIFFASYFVFAFGRLPTTRIDRTAMAVIGAVMMFVFRILSPQRAIASVDFNTLVLLFAMMLIVASLHLAGFFDWVANRVILHLSPRQLLPGVIFTSGILSAFLVNDVVCLFMAPLILDVCKRMGVRPLPYLLALATASNIGGAATITGNPQNMLIGTISGLSYRHFLAHLGPISVIGLLIDWAVIYWFYLRRKKTVVELPQSPAVEQRASVPANFRLLWPVIVTVAVLIGFFLGLQPPLVAAAGGALLLVRRTRDPREIYGDVDWSILVLFVGLFLIVGGAEEAGITSTLLQAAERLNLRNSVIFVSIVALLSNLVSNVPAVMLLKNLIPQLQDPHTMWLMLAMSSTLAGNLTITGSVANIIVVEKARTVTHISFFEYMKTGVPITIATLLVGLVWLQFVHF